LSQFGGNEVKTVFTGDNQVGPAAQAAAADVNKVGEAAENVNAKARGEGGFGGIGTSIKGAIKPLSDLIGGLQRTVGIFGIVGGAITALIAGVKSLADWMDQATSKVYRQQVALNQYRTALDQATNATDKTDRQSRQDDVNKRFDELRQQLGPIAKKLKSDNEVVALFRELEENRQKALAKIDEDIARKNRERSDLERDSLIGKQSVEKAIAQKDITLQVIRDRNSEEENLEREKQDQIRKIREAFNQESEQGKRDALIAQTEATFGRKIGEVRLREQEEFERRAQEVIQKSIDMEEKRARAIQETRDALRQLQDEQARGFGLAQAFNLGIVGQDTVLTDIIARRTGR